MGEKHKVLLVNNNSNGNVYGRKHNGIQEDLREAINHLGRKGLRWDLDLCKSGDAVEAASLRYDAVVISHNGNSEIETAIEIRSRDSGINIGYVTYYEKSRLPPELVVLIERFNIRNLEKRKIILAYKVHIDPKSINRIFCKAIIYLANTTQIKLNNFVNYASSLPGAIWPQRVMGNWDFELDLTFGF